MECNARGEAVIAAIDPLVSGIVGALITALGAYLAIARRFSGKIGTSDAAQLWAASEKMREWSQAQIEAFRMQVVALEARIRALEDQREQENAAFTIEVRGLTQTIIELRIEIVDLTDELRKSHARVQQLEGERKDDQRSE